MFSEAKILHFFDEQQIKKKILFDFGSGSSTSVEAVE